MTTTSRDPCRDEDGPDLEIYQVRGMVSGLKSFLADLRAIGSRHGCSIVCFNREAMAGRRHVREAVRHAVRSVSSGTLISRSPEVEALLFAAGTRQTGLIGPFGVHEGENECYLCLIPPSPDARTELTPLMASADDEDWKGIPPEKRKYLMSLFAITEEEIALCGEERLEDLVIERVALLEINR